MREETVTDAMVSAGADILRRAFTLDGISDQKLRLMVIMAHKAMAAAERADVDG